MEKAMDNERMVRIGERMVRLYNANTFEEAVGRKSVTHFWETLMSAEVGGEHIFAWRLCTCLYIARESGMQWLAELFEICDNRWWVCALTGQIKYAEMYNDCYGKIAEYVETLSEAEQEEFYNY